MATLIQQLLKKGLIDKEQASSLEFEVKESRKKEEELLIEKRVVAEDFLFSLRSENLKIPLKKIEPKEVPLETLGLIPEETVKHYRMIPLSKKDDFLEVGMIYPEDSKAQEALKFLAHQGRFNYRIFLVTPTNFNELLKQYRTLKGEVGRALEELKVELREEKMPTTAEEFERLAEEAPITKIVTVILKHAVDGEASDVHIEPCREKTRVRFRLLGNLHSSIFLPPRVHPAIIARIKILSNLKIDETRVPQDGRFSAKIDDRDIDFRVSTFPTALGEKVAIRILDPTIGLKKFEDLGLEKRNFEVVKRAIQRPYGLILATGPTGCGKSTTLYALLQILNKEGVNIITLEDPVEYLVEGINQSQIKPEINYDFARGLRHVLRQDPDIIMVGEIRDEETAFLVSHAALTGHIVLSTLHTNDALGGIPRLIDLGIKPYLVPAALSCILAQRLIRKLCQSCKKEVKPKKEINDLILKEIENLPPETKKTVKIKKPLTVFESSGCKKCNKEGFSGRIAVFEVVEMTDQLAEIILKEPTIESLQQEAGRQGMVTMFQDGILKALRGITTIEEVLRVAEER
ncbi:MAG TPA: GspE/PulE family protein [Candidatus Humimicrobiaceae bacterium]|nr:GspE/PulE family protein [Candidatus Humimicrobiaceae bacterium]